VEQDSLYEAAFPFADDVLSLPVTDLDSTAAWYSKAFGLIEIERKNSPVPTLIMQRDAAKVGFAINGGDASQDGAAILVSDIAQARDEIEATGVETGNWRIDERDGEKLQVFFVVAPDGLCFYFHQPIQ
jgi:catechol 2,3-dioxygenase-like lactoylglutathione lyase family enzyme